MQKESAKREAKSQVLASRFIGGRGCPARDTSRFIGAVRVGRPNPYENSVAMEWTIQG